MLLLLVTIYTVTHIALQTNKTNVAFPLSRWFEGFLLWVWPAGLDMTSNSPQIYSFCSRPHPKCGIFLKPQSIYAILCLIFPACALSPHSHPTPLLFFSVPLLAFSRLLSLRLEAKASSHSAKFMISLPSLEVKGTSRPVFPLFPVFGLSGAHLCMGGHGMLHRTHRFLTALSFTEAQSPRYPPCTAFS